MRLDVLPPPQNIDDYEMWIDEAIWGVRLYDEQLPWLTILEFLLIVQSKASEGVAFSEEGYNVLQYKPFTRLYLRNLLFNNPHLEVIADDPSNDKERWEKWLALFQSSVGGIALPDFSYLKSRFNSFKDFVEVVRFLKRNAIEKDTNKRWSSQFIFPYGPDCLFTDLQVKETESTADRRFFKRTGELLYLMLCRSGRGKEILSHLEKIGLIAKDYSPSYKGTKWNQLVLALQPEQDRTSFKSSGNPPYLPYAQLPEYERLAEDWLDILNCNLPDYDSLPHIVTITGLHLIIYLLSRAKATLGESTPPQFVLEIVAPKKTTVRELASDEFQKNDNLPQQAIEHYIRSTADLPEWQDCLNSGSSIDDATDLLKQYFSWSSAGGSSPDALLDDLRKDAVERHQKHLGKFHRTWSREIGLSSSRGSRRTRYAPTDSLLRTLVLASVPTRMEFQEFLAKLYQKYGFIIGDRQATDLINSGDADREDFVANAERLERRLASIGLLKRLSDACAYVQNPFASEVR
ncbi:hypothetical protein [Leptolyngbya sp. O-77]|uniref:hypothetical protein n=1 Tax=Leptolyngbya sp. O-77 TaxID=1080068 RepID=UPI00074D3032|nr:hypothetical protein [Leptolyngbya sp. O-77]BAU43566.1 hypothetical protein O77CONTIG1_03396 [Leptolyngbya sp. O-77]